MVQRARLIIDVNRVVEDPLTGDALEKLSVKIWYVPCDSEYPYGIKYSLQFARWTGDGYDNDYLRYDNYCGHGDHKHICGQRLPYRFVDVSTLIEDFNSDAVNLLGFKLIS